MSNFIIIGSGPAGLAAALSARRHGVDCLVLERGVIADTVYHYPLCKPLFSTSNELELETGALPAEHKPTREQVLDHYISLAVREHIQIHTGEEALAITPESGGFLVTTTLQTYRAQTVLVATGGFGRQRKLGVPGEDPARVSYRFVEAYPYAMKPVLVAGGGNSAAEAALFLTEVGADVALSLRDAALDHPSRSTGKPKIKPWVREPLERAAREGRLQVITSSEIVEIGSRSAFLRIALGESGEVVEVACDHIFALIGADPDTRLLETAGAEIAADGRPVYDPETYETTVPNLYVAGHLTRELHAKQAIAVGRRVGAHIAARRGREQAADVDLQPQAIL